MSNQRNTGRHDVEISTVIIISVIIGAVLVTVAKCVNEWIATCMIIVGILLILTPAYAFVWFMVRFIVLGLKRANKCEIECFQQLDLFKYEYERCSSNYERAIKAVKFYYNKGCYVDKMVETHQIASLYERLEYLSKQDEYFENIRNISSAVITSIIASFIIAYFSYDEYSVVRYIMLAAIFVLALCVLVMPYYFKGRGGSYLYYVDLYEKKLLEEKISGFYEDVNYTDELEIELIKKQIVLIKKLNNISSKKSKKEKKEISEDIRNLMSLDFKDQDYSQFEDISLVKQLENDELRNNPKNSNLEYMAKIAQKYGVVQEIDGIKI